MRNRIATIICALLPFLGCSQNDAALSSAQNKGDSTSSKKKIGYGISMNQSLTRYGFPTAVLFTLKYGKHQFDLGPQFWVGRSFNADQKNLGLEFNYRCYLAGDEHWFSPYVLFNLGYFHEYNAYDSFIYSGTPYTIPQPTRRSEAFDNLALNAGYGVKFRLSKVFYLGSNIGVGYLSSLYTSKTETTSGDYSHTSKSHDGYIGFVAAVYLGFSFNR